jgi:hypothetical protein
MIRQVGYCLRWMLAPKETSQFAWNIVHRTGQVARDTTSRFDERKSFWSRVALRWRFMASSYHKSPNQITAHNAGDPSQFRFAGSVHWPGVCEFYR